MIAKEKEILRGLISENKCQFVIPVFQRNYDWREKDCRKLFLRSQCRTSQNQSLPFCLYLFLCIFVMCVIRHFVLPG